MGTSDYSVNSADASTQGGPSQLELSSFLQDLSLGAVSSPVARGPVSVLSPNFQRYLDTGAALRSPPPAPRIAVCRGTSTRDEVQFVDASTDAIFIIVDKSVQAVVEHCDVSTEHDPPVESPTVVPASADDVPASVDLDVTPTALFSADSTESVLTMFLHQ